MYHSRRALNGYMSRSRHLVDFLIRRAEAAWEVGNGETAVVWAQAAAEMAWVLHPGYYTSPRLEGLLMRIARSLDPVTMPTVQWAPSATKRVLHVITTAYSVGGHTRWSERWIRTGIAFGESHAVILTDQRNLPVPESLRACVVASGGSLTILENMGILDRARALRALSWNGPDSILLNVHPHDPVPNLALGMDGGSPVLFINLADHVFWLGAGIADLVVDARPSGYMCTLERRGASKNALLPLPLEDLQSATSRQDVRRELGIPADACLLLTVASEYKYAPSPPWDFASLLFRVLSRAPNAHLVAAGPSEEWGWTALSQKFPTRVHALGEQMNASRLYGAADIYVDSLPLTSPTSLLEAGLSGLPLHRRWDPRAPLMAGDDVALDKLPRYGTPDAYVEGLLDLIAEPTMRRQLGATARERILEAHVGPSWVGLRASVLAKLPACHTVKVTENLTPFDGGDIAWADFQRKALALRPGNLGLQVLSRYRARLSPADRLAVTIRLVCIHPRYLTQPKDALRIIRHVLLLERRKRGVPDG